MTNIQTQRDLKTILEKDNNKQRFANILGKEQAEYFVASLLSVVNEDKLLAKAEPLSIINAAMIAATLKLPINKNLGFAYIIPYNNKAQFQMGYKGFIQLASRTGQVKKINVGFLSKEQFISYDPITETLKYDMSKPSGVPYVYVGYLELVNGFTKYLVKTTDELKAHAQKYSTSYNYGSSVWKTNFEAMAQKTVIKKLLSTFAPLDTDMQVHTAIATDQAVINEDNSLDYIDNPQNIKDENKANVIKNKEDSKVTTNFAELPWDEQEKKMDNVFNKMDTTNTGVNK